MQQHDTASPLAPRKLTYSEAAHNPDDPAPAGSDVAINLSAVPWPGLHRRFPFQGTEPQTADEKKRTSELESGEEESSTDDPMQGMDPPYQVDYF